MGGRAMSSLPGLPPIDNFKSNDIEDSTNALSNKEYFDKKHFDNDTNSSNINYYEESNLMLTGELAEEYEKIKKSYRELIHSFEKSLQRDLQVTTSNKSSLKRYRFRNLSDFESSVQNGFLDLNDYTSKEINDLIKELNELENRMITRSLDEYNFITIDDFQSAVDRGIIDLSRYSIDEINDLLANLEDEPLTIRDYDIEMFGDVQLPDIEEVLNTKQKPTYKKQKSPQREINNNYSQIDYNKGSLPSPPKYAESEVKHNKTIEKPPEHIYEDSDDNIEDLMDDNIFKQTWRWIKSLFD